MVFSDNTNTDQDDSPVGSPVPVPSSVKESSPSEVSNSDDDKPISSLVINKNIETEDNIEENIENESEGQEGEEGEEGEESEGSDFIDREEGTKSIDEEKLDEDGSSPVHTNGKLESNGKDEGTKSFFELGQDDVLNEKLKTNDIITNKKYNESLKSTKKEIVDKDGNPVDTEDLTTTIGEDYMLVKKNILIGQDVKDEIYFVTGDTETYKKDVPYENEKIDKKMKILMANKKPKEKSISKKKEKTRRNIKNLDGQTLIKELVFTNGSPSDNILKLTFLFDNINLMGKWSGVSWKNNYCKLYRGGSVAFRLDKDIKVKRLVLKFKKIGNQDLKFFIGFEKHTAYFKLLGGSGNIKADVYNRKSKSFRGGIFAGSDFMKKIDNQKVQPPNLWDYFTKYDVIKKRIFDRMSRRNYACRLPFWYKIPFVDDTVIDLWDDDKSDTPPEDNFEIEYAN